jgi:hypothetical protein
MLSERARQYLASLKRLPAVPTATVEKVLKDQGGPCFPAWLDFHERYAGYVEPLGLDSAVLGIVHAQSHWLKPGGAAVSRSYEPGAEWFVTCAEAHPSYVYELGDTGFFKVPAAASFEIKLERSALRMAFMSRPGAAWTPPGVRDDPELARLAAAAARVPEASDDHFQALLGPRFYGLRDATSGAWIDRAVCP